jgi:hypothetical protein
LPWLFEDCPEWLLRWLKALQAVQQAKVIEATQLFSTLFIGGIKWLLHAWTDRNLPIQSFAISKVCILAQILPLPDSTAA